MSDMDMLAAMGISGFGKVTKKHQLDPGRFDKNKRDEETVSDTTPAPGPTPAQSHAEAVQTGTTDEHDEGSEEPEDDPSSDTDEPDPQFPTTHEIILKDHTKVISALALDPSGARILSGSHDYDVKLWDFGGMDHRCRPFKSWEPAGSYYLNDLKYSNDGQRFLVVSGTTQVKMYGRDGEGEVTYVKGDPYLRDMKNTAGHVGEVLGCVWHPRDGQTFITASADSTIRIWDVERRRRQKTVIVAKSKERGARTKVTACAYSTDGHMIAGSCLDGALHVWPANSNFVRPGLSIDGAHTRGTETGSVVFSVDGRTVLTRGGDDSVKLWDVRAFRTPVAVRTQLGTLYPHTNATFSPDERYILTGAGAQARGGTGRLVFLDRQLAVAKTLDVASTPVKVVWHSKINQIVAGLSSGHICVLYSPQSSLNGAKLLLNKGPARRMTVEDMSSALVAPSILTPHALPMFRDGDGVGGATKRKRDRDRMDPRKSRRPELPVTGPGKGGRVGASATQHVVQNLVRDTTRDEDPREALLKYAQGDAQWTAAWATTQPTPVFADAEEEEEQ